MKKSISLLLALIMLLSITAGLDFSAYALASSGSCGTNVTYKYVSSTGTLTISGTGNMKNYSDSSRSPFYNSTIQKVVINSGVVSIGDYAFQNCSALKNITIPNSVTSIGNYAFRYCSVLTNITIPNSVTSIGSTAFRDCTGLTSITIPDSVTSIGNSAFYGCTGLTNITIPNSVTSIGNSAFYGCTGLTSVTIGKGVTSIGSFAFKNCSALTNITIPNSVTSIGDYAFYCTGLTSIIIPTSVTSIGIMAFEGCSNCKVYYTGSTTEWEKISGKNYVNSSSIIYNYEIPNCSHTYNRGTVTTQPNCINSGVKKSTCTLCGTTKTETIKALGHNYVTTVKKATPNNGGYSDTKCSRCGVDHYKYIDAPQYISLSKYDYIYNGKVCTPKVTVYNEAGNTISSEHYNVTYPSGRKKLGTYTVKVVFKGKYYSGTMTEKFSISPPQVKFNSIKSKPYSKKEISVSWKKIKGVDGYMVYRWSNKKRKYVLYKKTNKTKIIIPRENKKTNEVSFAIATYKKQGNKTYESNMVGGYDWVKLSAPTFKTEQNDIKEFTMVFPYKDYYYIQWSNNPDFSVDDKNRNKNYWVHTGKYTDKKVGRIRIYNLKANQTVYVRARKAYYNKKGKLVLGPWSKSKKVVTY